MTSDDPEPWSTRLDQPGTIMSSSCVRRRSITTELITIPRCLVWSRIITAYFFNERFNERGDLLGLSCESGHETSDQIPPTVRLAVASSLRERKDRCRPCDSSLTYSDRTNIVSQVRFNPWRIISDYKTNETALRIRMIPSPPARQRHSRSRMQSGFGPIYRCGQSRVMN